LELLSVSLSPGHLIVGLSHGDVRQSNWVTLCDCSHEIELSGTKLLLLTLQLLEETLAILGILLCLLDALLFCLFAFLSSTLRVVDRIAGINNTQVAQVIDNKQTKQVITSFSELPNRSSQTSS